MSAGGWPADHRRHRAAPRDDPDVARRYAAERSRTHVRRLRLVARADRLPGIARRRRRDRPCRAELRAARRVQARDGFQIGALRNGAPEPHETRSRAPSAARPAAGGPGPTARRRCRASATPISPARVAPRRARSVAVGRRLRGRHDRRGPAESTAGRRAVCRAATAARRNRRRQATHARASDRRPFIRDLRPASRRAGGVTASASSAPAASAPP